MYAKESKEEYPKRLDTFPKLRIKGTYYCHAFIFDSIEPNLEIEEQLPELLRQLKFREEQDLGILLEQTLLLYYMADYDQCNVILDNIFEIIKKSEQHIDDKIWMTYYTMKIKILLGENDTKSAKKKLDKAFKYYQKSCVTNENGYALLNKLEVELEEKIKLQNPQFFSNFTFFGNTDLSTESQTSDEKKCIIS